MIFIFDQFYSVFSLYPDLGSTAQWFVRRIHYSSCFSAVPVINHGLVSIVVRLVGLTGQYGLSLAAGAITANLVLVDVYNGLHGVYTKTTIKSLDSDGQ
jgi:hypothetical protein